MWTEPDLRSSRDMRTRQSGCNSAITWTKPICNTRSRQKQHSAYLVSGFTQAVAYSLSTNLPWGPRNSFKVRSLEVVTPWQQHALNLDHDGGKDQREDDSDGKFREHLRDDVQTTSLENRMTKTVCR